MLALDRLLRYPPELQARLAETGSLDLGEGCATAEDIWRFMTLEGPARYPHFFTGNALTGMSGDLSLVSGVRRYYLQFTLYDRISQARERGTPIVLTRGLPSELFEAAGCLPISPDQASQSMVARPEKAGSRGLRIGSTGKQELTFEACYPAKYGLNPERGWPVSLIALGTGMKCSDLACGAAAHAHGGLKTPVSLIDRPVSGGPGDGGAVSYLAQSLRRLAPGLSSLGGSEITDDALRSAIRLQNRKRRLARAYAELWWATGVPPTNSEDHAAILRLGSESYGAPAAAATVLRESFEETKVRANRSIKGQGVAEDPVRLFLCGCCVSPGLKLVDSLGGVVVGMDDALSEISTDAGETGDPWERLAEALLSSPCELAGEERSRWTADQVRRSKADGLLFMYQPGCNYQAAASRLISDVVKEETGIPSLLLQQSPAGCPAAQEPLRNRIEAFIEMLR